MTKDNYSWLDSLMSAVVTEAIAYQAANDGEDTLTHARYLEESRKEAIAAINTYTTNKIIEARIDELLYLTNHADPLVLDRVWIQNRIKALNHRKDKDGRI